MYLPDLCVLFAQVAGERDAWPAVVWLDRSAAFLEVSLGFASSLLFVESLPWQQIVVASLVSAVVS